MEVIADQRLPGASVAHADTKIIPSIAASERYDSNVYISPSQFIPTGKQKWDFVTSVIPQVNVNIKGRQVIADVYTGMSASRFINNSELNFISVNAGGVINLDGFVSQFIRGLKLRIADTFYYTPELPAFVTGIKTPSTQDPFAQGIQAVRANTYTNTATLTGDYAVSRTVSILGTYTNAIFKVGQVFATQTTGAGQFTPAFFNTIYQTWSVGPGVRLTRYDGLSLKYQRSSADLSQGGTTTHFASNGFAAEYTRTTKDWIATISGGPTVLEQGGGAFFSGQLSFTGAIDQSTQARVAISRQAAPAFFGTGGAYISTTATASMQRRLSRVLTVTGNINYGYNEATPVKILTFHSFIGSAGINYNITKTLSTSLSYNYTNFRTYQPGNVKLVTDRSFVTFTVMYLWK
jgi:hypothetical protein